MRTCQHFFFFFFSSFFVAMVVADDIAQFLTRANSLNSIHRKTLYNSEGNVRDEFQGQNSRAENRSRDIIPTSELSFAHALSVSGN